ncbi:MAG TPA: glycosyltransferase family 2 protein [bacterium]|nr:glycosyltransferase family 2 protein [bacterium]
MPAAERVTTVIPNWNGIRFLGECLAGLASQTSGRPRVIVIDNGSTDGSADFIKENFSWVKLIESPVNEGFSRAVNRGIALCETEFVFLLNNDAVPEPGCIENLVDVMDRNSNIHSCACKVVFYDDPETIDSAGDDYTPWGMVFNRGHGKPAGDFISETPVFGPCAAAALYRKSLFDSIGLFEENIFAYYEDTDLNMRAALSGLNCLFVPGAVVKHHYSGSSSGTVSKLGKEQVYIHLTGVYFKNMPAAFIAKHLVSVTAVHSAILFFYALAKLRRSNRLPAVPLFNFMKSMLKKRHDIVGNKSISNKDLKKKFLYGSFMDYLSDKKRI